MGFDPRRWDGIRGGSARVTVGTGSRWVDRQPWAGEQRERAHDPEAWGWSGRSPMGEQEVWSTDGETGAGEHRDRVPDPEAMGSTGRSRTGGRHNGSARGEGRADERQERVSDRQTWGSAGWSRAGGWEQAVTEPPQRPRRSSGARRVAWTSEATEPPSPRSEPRPQQHQREPAREPRTPDHNTGAPRSRVTVGAAPGITPDTVRRWGEAMASHPRWGALPLEPLNALGRRGHARGLDPSLPLEEALERISPGLGRELRWALAGPRSRARLAVRAAFALYGPRAADRLDRRPLEVVAELLTACSIDPGRAGGPNQSRGRSQGPGEGRTAGDWGTNREEPRHRRTRGADPQDAEPNNSNRQGAQRDRSDRANADHDQQHRSDKGPGSSRRSPIDPQRREALIVLGLEPDASPAAVKAAHRRLVKRHHPDVGGDAESFRRVDAAYRLLIA